MMKYIKNYTIILAVILSIFLVGCGATPEVTKTYTIEVDGETYYAESEEELQEILSQITAIDLSIDVEDTPQQNASPTKTPISTVAPAQEKEVSDDSENQPTPEITPVDSSDSTFSTTEKTLAIGEWVQLSVDGKTLQFRFDGFTSLQDKGTFGTFVMMLCAIENVSDSNYDTYNFFENNVKITDADGFLLSPSNYGWDYETYGCNTDIASGEKKRVVKAFAYNENVDDLAITISDDSGSYAFSKSVPNENNNMKTDTGASDGANLKVVDVENIWYDFDDENHYTIYLKIRNKSGMSLGQVLPSIDIIDDNGDIVASTAAGFFQILDDGQGCTIDSDRVESTNAPYGIRISRMFIEDTAGNLEEIVINPAYVVENIPSSTPKEQDSKENSPTQLQNSKATSSEFTPESTPTPEPTPKPTPKPTAKPTPKATAKPSTSSTNDGYIAKDREIDAWVCAQDIVENNLKAPSTAKFCKYPDATVTYLGGADYMIFGWVDAENGYGAKLRTNFVVTLTLTEKGYTNGYVLFDE